mmetsp:Transcript_74479/g.155267  ORF Transcript_74479/g.155267 Transcript_74479/m.155267 type:complete len:561 (+) Transcript_74479:153-1835(+)|eukprot:CAMPEP_0206462878 /NCGR_PEP_ID=MMETSP0324_2-20121206/26248_1 /ASSEMBLY_ACC=CAM_ASM_000836 /TAXON_ID=2866 /ORGANISM="Crypthecodinium cohnii, Strain Seligo" /LENGTH=560 /DNA_ID=CAMNT_0053935133 /DNA_START=111 /DNA_END=1793 /DNA_ORIENTATION=+
MAPKKHGGMSGGEPPLKKMKPGAAVWEWQDGKNWKAFNEEDTNMLEEKFKTGGSKAVFHTTEFSFNKGYDTIYEVSFSKMTQKNMDSKKLRNIRRKDPKGMANASWEWWTDEDCWAEYNAEDKALLEKAFNAGITPFETKQLSFNKGYDSLYIFDFDVMTQVNCDSGTSRKIQRTAAGGSKMMGHTKGEDDAYADVLLAAKDSDATAGAAPGMKFKLDLPAHVKDAQKKKGAQSLRSQKREYGPIVSKDAHGKKCFDQMLENEQEFAGEWVVFYHSYSAAALLYEVQAAVGSVLFRFKAEFAGLPRILAHGFKHIPDAKRMLEEFPKWKDKDHNPAFKAVGLCATSSLLAPDSEAPAKSVFLAGYSVGSLKGVLEKLLGAVGVPKGMIAKLAKDIIALSAKHGLDTCGIPGGKKCKSGRSGHMLQIFLRRELCDQFVYPAFPFGVPDKKRDLPLSKYLCDKAPIEGQVRITLNPDVFLRATYARMFTFSADPTYHGNRPNFIKELKELLEPILGDEAVREKAAKGIFGGKPPDWWTPEDQSEMAAMPLARFAKSDMAEDE